MKSKTKVYAFFIILTLAVGGLSALLTKDNMNIYDSINTPSFAPPAIVFPIAWGILYVLMGIGAGCVYLKGREKEIDTKPALTVYFLQLLVNFFWSIIFFNMQRFLPAFFWLLLLLLLVCIMTVRFYRICKICGLIQIPYILWLVFAGILNYAIFTLNV